MYRVLAAHLAKEGITVNNILTGAAAATSDWSLAFADQGCMRISMGLVS
jgi:hypothetical protein